MKAYRVQMTTGLFIMASLVGCAPSPIVLHPGFGNSVSLARQSQIMNPDTPKNLDPMISFQGRPVGKAVIQYEKSFDQKQKKANAVGILVTPGGK